MPDPPSIGRKQLTVLFVSSLLVLMYANPLVRLLPVHASQMGASPSQVGVYLALVYASLALSTFVAGWLSDRYQRQKATIIVAGLIASLGLALMGRSTSLWQLSLATMSVWFFGGITYAMFTILAGLFAGDNQRGKVFGLLAVTLPLSNFLGAPVAGRIADLWGYPALLAGYAVYALTIPLLALLIVDRRVVAETPADTEVDAVTVRRRRFSAGLYFLVAATSVMAFVSFVNSLGLSLVMHVQTYSSTQIAVAVALGALVSIPFSFGAGWLSDYVPRKALLIACYVVVGAGTLTLATAGALWQFWIASILLAVMTAGTSLSNALATDLAPKALVGGALSLTNGMRWIGAVAGFAAAGFAIDILGARMALFAVFVMVPVAIFLAWQIQPSAALSHQELEPIGQ